MKVSHIAQFVVLASPLVSAGICTGSSANIPDSECKVWGEMWTDLSGPTWHMCNTTAYQTDPCSCKGTFPGPCQGGQCWSNVGCDDAKTHIVGFKLGLGMKGTIPESISQLTAVTFIYIQAHDTALTGALPASIGSMPNRQHA